MAVLHPSGRIMAEGTAVALTVAYGIFFILNFVLVGRLWNKRDTLFVRRKSWPLLLCSNVGVQFMAATQVVYTWSFARTAIEGNVIWWLAQTLYYTGFVLMFGAMAIRTWRIVVLFSRVPALLWTCCGGGKSRQEGDRVLLCCVVRVPPKIRRMELNDVWCYKRLAVAVFPVCVITFGFLPFGATKLGELAWTYYDLAALVAYYLMAARLFCIRARVTLEELVETRMLLLFALSGLIYYIIDNILWFGYVRTIDVNDTTHRSAEILAGFIVLQVVFFAMLVLSNIGYVVHALNLHEAEEGGRDVVNPLAAQEAGRGGGRQISGDRQLRRPESEGAGVRRAVMP